MKTLACIIAVAALVIGMAGCITPPPQKVVGGPNDYGQFPTNSAIFVKSYIAAFFKDPDSVKDLSIDQPIPTWTIQQIDGAKIYCYGICFFANAKNSYGAYAGLHSTWVYVRDGVPILSVSP